MLVGSRDILQMMGYQELTEEGLEFRSNVTEPNRSTISSLASDLVLARIEIDAAHSGTHPHPETFFSALRGVPVPASPGGSQFGQQPGMFESSNPPFQNRFAPPPNHAAYPQQPGPPPQQFGPRPMQGGYFVPPHGSTNYGPSDPVQGVNPNPGQGPSRFVSFQAPDPQRHTLPRASSLPKFNDPADHQLGPGHPSRHRSDPSWDPYSQRFDAGTGPPGHGMPQYGMDPRGQMDSQRDMPGMDSQYTGQGQYYKSHTLPRSGGTYQDPSSGGGYDRQYSDDLGSPGRDVHPGFSRTAGHPGPPQQRHSGVLAHTIQEEPEQLLPSRPDERSQQYGRQPPSQQAQDSQPQRAPSHSALRDTKSNDTAGDSSESDTFLTPSGSPSVSQNNSGRIEPPKRTEPVAARPLPRQAWAADAPLPYGGERNTMAREPYDGETPGVHHGRNSAGTSHDGSPAGTPHSGRLPGAPHSGHMPGAPHSGHMSNAPHSERLPGAPHSGRMPGAPHSGHMPGAPHSGRMPGASYSGHMPGTAYGGDGNLPGRQHSGNVSGYSDPATGQGTPGKSRFDGIPWRQQTVAWQSPHSADLPSESGRSKQSPVTHGGAAYQNDPPRFSGPQGTARDGAPQPRIRSGHHVPPSPGQVSDDQSKLSSSPANRGRQSSTEQLLAQLSISEGDGLCDFCGQKASSVFCHDCAEDKNLCNDCDQLKHGNRRRGAHKRTRTDGGSFGE